MSKLNNQSGVGLVEVLVSLLILAIAILGYTAVQGNALQLTDESTQRTQSLALMRDIGEKIRMNPIGLPEYKAQINATTAATEPPKGCGLVGSSNEVCTAAELATAEAFVFKRDILASGYSISMVACPSSGGVKDGTQDENNIMFSNCLIAAWGDTSATVGNNATLSKDNKIDCIKARSGTGNNIDTGGSYHRDATCLLMELT